MTSRRGQSTSFQSTLPTRGSDASISACNANACISIHAPHEGERPHDFNTPELLGHFNPRSPRGGATNIVENIIVAKEISIHAPHEGERPATVAEDYVTILISIHAPHEGERRVRRCTGSRVTNNFNPRSPRGGATLTPYFLSPSTEGFQSTLPTRGSDHAVFSVPVHRGISIHAPHEGERLTPFFNQAPSP